MKSEKGSIPRYWSIPGTLLGVLVLFFLYVISKNEYLIPKETGRIIFASFLIACLVIKLITKKKIHILFISVLFLTFYNFLMILGGFFFIGWKIVPIGIGIVLVTALVLRGVPYWMRIGTGIIVVAVIGLAAVYFEREYGPDKCNIELEKKAPVFQMFDKAMHCYDFAVTSDPPLLFATFGLTKKLKAFTLDYLQQTFIVRLPLRGVQRLTTLPDNRRLYLSAWGHWKGNRVLSVLNAQSQKIEKTFNTDGCRNAFEAVHDAKRDRVYLLCEASHNLLAYREGKSTPYAQLTLPGWNSYDLILDHSKDRLYVTDWLSPFLFVVDLKTFTLLQKVRIGWTAFGIVESQDGTIFVARPIVSEAVAVDPVSLQVKKRIKTGFGSRDLEYDPKRNILFVGNYFDGTLDLYDADTGKRISRHYAGRLLRGLLYHAESDRIFLATGCGLLWAKVEQLLEPALN